MKHNFDEVFDTTSPYWQRVLDIFDKNEKYEKKKVSNRNLHHKFPRSFSKKLGEPVDNDRDNLISLSLADHFLVHYYYYKLAKKGFRQSMATAFTFMTKKCIKFMTPDTAEAMAKDYDEAMNFIYRDPEARRKNSESKKGVPHPHKWGQHTEEQLRTLEERCRKLCYDKFASDFGRAYFERYHLRQRDNRKLYQRERTYYKKYGRYSWDDGIDLTKNKLSEIEFNGVYDEGKED